MRKYNHIAVLKGGLSQERSVSLNSGAACAAALREAGYQVTEIDVDKNIDQQLRAINPDAAFNALHGRYGEDGMIQGLLELLRIPYTHSGVMASSLAMDKSRAKIVMAEAGVPVAKGVIADRKDILARHILPPPYVVKPPLEGSSVGVVIVKDEMSNAREILNSPEWVYGDELMVEEFIPGKELTCGYLGSEAGKGRAFGVIDIIHEEGFYDFKAKYAKGGSEHIIPANILPDIYQNIQQLTQIAHDALGCKGVSRADFRLDMNADGNPRLVCLEVNTQPGMTETSLIPDMARAEGISFVELVTWIIEDASLLR